MEMKNEGSNTESYCQNLFTHCGTVRSFQRNPSSSSHDSRTGALQDDFNTSARRSVKTSSSSSVVQRNLEIHLSASQQGKIRNILDAVATLTDMEKLLLYLKLPSKENEEPMNLSNSKQEQTEAFQWIRQNLEECDPSVNLPKHEVYDLYKSHFDGKDTRRVLSAPDFGKIVKCLFPNIKARRLGTRGNSKYCYTGLRRKEVTAPTKLPDICAQQSVKKQEIDDTIEKKEKKEEPIKDSMDEIFTAASFIVCEWANKLLGKYFVTLVDLAKFLVGGSYVSSKSVSAFTIMGLTKEDLQSISDRLTLIQSKNIKKEPVTSSCSYDVNKPLTLPSTVTTPSRIVNGILNKKESPSVSPTSDAQIVPTTPVKVESNGAKVQELITSDRKISKEFNLEEITVDVSSPVLIDSSAKSKQASTVLLDNVKLHLASDKQDLVLNTTTVPVSLIASPLFTPKKISTQPSSLSPMKPLSFSINGNDEEKGSPSKRMKKKPDNLPALGTTNMIQQNSVLLTTTVPTMNQLTTTTTQLITRKVGRPRGKKNNLNQPLFYSPQHVTSGPKANVSPVGRCGNMPPPTFGNGTNMINRFCQQSPSPSPLRGVPSPSDKELQSIFSRAQARTTNYRPEVQRCQSVPVSQLASPNHFQPLTPQWTYPPLVTQPLETLKAKRNLTFMFNSSESSNEMNNFGVSIPANNHTSVQAENQQIHYMKTDHVVPSFKGPLQVNTQFDPNYLPNEEKLGQNITDLGLNLNDLPTPDELDIPSTFDTPTDSDELLKSLQTTSNMWNKEWALNTLIEPT